MRLKTKKTFANTTQTPAAASPLADDRGLDTRCAAWEESILQLFME